MGDLWWKVHSAQFVFFRGCSIFLIPYQNEYCGIDLPIKNIFVGMSWHFNIRLLEIKNYETYYRSARVQVWTISEYLLTISNNILLYLGLSQSILDYLGLSLCISVYLCLSRSILVYVGLCLSMLVYVGLSLSILVYLCLSWSISDYLGLYWTFSPYLPQCVMSSTLE